MIRPAVDITKQNLPVVTAAPTGEVKCPNCARTFASVPGVMIQVCQCGAPFKLAAGTFQR